MRDESHCLTSAQLNALALGAAEDESTLDHLVDCQHCDAAIERLIAEEEERIFRASIVGPPDRWFLNAATEAFHEIQGDRSSPTHAGDRISGTQKTASSVSRKSSRRSIAPLQRRFWPLLFAGLASTAALLAMVFSFLPVRSLDDDTAPEHREGVGPSHDGPTATERAGGVSARLVCSDRPEFELRGGPLFCSPTATLEVHAEASERNRLPLVTVVACDRDTSCTVLAGARFDGAAEVAIPVAQTSAARARELIVIWSDREVSESLLADAAGRRSNAGEGAGFLMIPRAWAQVILPLASDNATPPR